MIRMKNIRAAEVDLARQRVYGTAGSGAPTNGTSGTGVGKCGPGSTYVDTATGIVYVNTTAVTSPTWVKVGVQT